MSTPASKLTALRPDYDKLIERLGILVPQVRAQAQATNKAAEDAYFNSERATDAERKMWTERHSMTGTTLLAIAYAPVDSPESRELDSIGRAVAAFGGVDAIEQLGSDLQMRGDDCGQYVWERWDGFAGFWL
jgi:hypothetical protein